jgi:hypothetical protein
VVDQRSEHLAKRFDAHVLDGIPDLRKHGYNPSLFLQMVERHGGVYAATKALLADSRHTSYGFQRLYDMRRLDASVEYAVCLPWFRELFTNSEVDEAEMRLIAHEFPLATRIEAAAGTPPVWLDDLPS